MKGLRTIGRRNFIVSFSCSDHFIEMVWQRKIEVEQVIPALKEVAELKHPKFCLLIPLDQRTKDGSDTLLLKVKKGCLITGFFICLGAYRGKNKRDSFVLSSFKYKTKK
jgi:hypothetical protein